MEVLITGANGRLGKELVKTNPGHKIIQMTRQNGDLDNRSAIDHHISYHQPDIVIHCAALTNPLKEHKDHPEKSILANIVGTSNVALSCIEHQIKLVFISTDYVYYGKGPHKEDEPLKPIDNYGASKLAGECITKMLDDSLILRCSFTERPFRHDKAFTDSTKSFVYLDEIGEKIWKVINETGIINIGGKAQSVYEFAKQSKPNIIPISINSIDEPIPNDTSLDLTRYDSIIQNTSN